MTSILDSIFRCSIAELLAHHGPHHEPALAEDCLWSSPNIPSIYQAVECATVQSCYLSSS